MLAFKICQGLIISLKKLFFWKFESEFSSNRSEIIRWCLMAVTTGWGLEDRGSIPDRGKSLTPGFDLK